MGAAAAHSNFTSCVSDVRRDAQEVCYQNGGAASSDVALPLVARPCACDFGGKSFCRKSPQVCFINSSRGEQDQQLQNQTDNAQMHNLGSADETCLERVVGHGMDVALVKHFVRGLVKGQSVALLFANGGITECTLRVDRGLTTLSLQLVGRTSQKKRAIPLQDIEAILAGKHSGQQFGLLTDDRSVTLVLTSGQGVAFTLPSLQDRETFVLCLSKFVDGCRLQTTKQADSIPSEAKGV